MPITSSGAKLELENRSAGEGNMHPMTLSSSSWIDSGISLFAIKIGASWLATVAAVAGVAAEETTRRWCRICLAIVMEDCTKNFFSSLEL